MVNYSYILISVAQVDLSDVLIIVAEIQSEHMVKHHHVYMLKSGRISMCGLTPANVAYVAKAINETLKTLPHKL